MSWGGYGSLVRRGLLPGALNLILGDDCISLFEITTHGKAAHSSVPQEGLNAIYKMRKVMEQIEHLSERLKSKSHPILGSPTVSVGTIEGGTSPWTVPEFCRIVIDRRTIPGETTDEVQGELNLLLKKLRHEDSQIEIQTRIYQVAEAAQIPSEEKIVRIAEDEVSSVTGLLPKVGGLSATTDARFLINQAGIPTIILGPGSLSQAHRANEHVSLTEVHQAANIFARIAAKALQ